MVEQRIDPITLEILSSAYKSVTEECFIALMKSALSTNIKERKDHSTAILDARGRLIMQTMVSPIHIASMTASLRAVLDKFGTGARGGIQPGDIFVSNDPHAAGGTHLPDVNLTTPVFADGELIAFVLNIAHHADIGGMAPGSMIGGMSEIYQEGLRIPAIRLFRNDVLQEDVMDLLLLNARLPEERRGDYFAQIAAARLGRARLGDIIAQHGAPRVRASFDEMIALTAARTRRLIDLVPDGKAAFADVMDGDGCGTTDIGIALDLTVQGPRIRFDFSQSDAQVEGNVNVTFNATQASVCYAFQAMLDPYISGNQGLIDAIEIVAPEGSLLNARFPAAVGNRAHTCQRIIDVVFGAMARLLPEKAMAAGNGANTMAVFSGHHPETGAGYVYLETIGGGKGAQRNLDGKDGVQVGATNTSNLPTEAIEMEYPLLIEEYGLVPDSGGAGAWRGGSGIRRLVRPLGHVVTFSGVGERFTHSPWGLFGGADGASGRFAIRDDDGTETELSGKPSGQKVTPREVVIIESPGAGGYGCPADRPAAAREKDVRDGTMSERYLADFD